MIRFLLRRAILIAKSIRLSAVAANLAKDAQEEQRFVEAAERLVPLVQWVEL